MFEYSRGDGITRAEWYNNRLQPVESYYSLGNVNTPAAMLFVSCPHWGSGTVSDIYAVCQAGPAVPNNGNLAAYDEYLGAPGATALTEFSQPQTANPAIAYDGANRLTNISDTGGWSRSFAYDQWGNMTESGSVPVLNINAPQGLPSAIYNANNQRTDTGLAYDAAGNVNAMNGFSNITYDAESRLLTESSPSAFTYAYDGNGRRVMKSGPGGTTVYVYDAQGQLAAEYNTASSPPPPACTTCYLSYDYLGSVRMVTNSSGVVVSRHDFLPFGEEVPQGSAGRMASLGFGDTDYVSERFTGKERDSESGMDYFGARYYGSALGRFTTPDWSARQQPVPYANFRNPQSLNLYLYMQNNPLSGTDPDGHCCDWNDVRQFGSGFADTTYRPIVQAVSHPLDTGAALINAASHPINTAVAVGDAVVATGKAALSGDPKALGQVTGTVVSALATAGAAKAISGLVEGAEVGAATTTVTHFTSDAGVAAISESGTLNTGTWVTLPSQIPAGSSSSAVESILEIGPGKGANSITFDTPSSNLAVPGNGPTTSGGATQFQLKNPQSIDPTKFKPTN